jgi:competence protein ComEA
VKRRWISFWIIVWLATCLGDVAATGGKLQAQQNLLPEGEGKDVVKRMCHDCHAMETVVSPRYSKDRWASVVDDMMAFGAQGSDDDIEIVVEYLAKHFGPERPRAAGSKTPSLDKVNVNTANVPELAAVLQLSVEDARAIVRYREKDGKFQNWRDVTKAPGIDSKKIEEKKDLLVF